MPTDEATAAETAPPRRAPGRRPRTSLWVLRIVALAHTATIGLQPVFAGIYLAGDLDAITVHELNSHLVTTLAWVQIFAAVAYVWRGHGAVWPLLVSIGLGILEEGQKVLGYLRLTEFHLPFGITLITVQVVLTVWLCGPAARQARLPREPRP